MNNTHSSLLSYLYSYHLLVGPHKYSNIPRPVHQSLKVSYNTKVQLTPGLFGRIISSRVLLESEDPPATAEGDINRTNSVKDERKDKNNKG